MMADRMDKYDIDLRQGQAREHAFVNVLLRAHVEHKRDKKAARTGNVAIEIETVYKSGDIAPSGVMVTQAQFFAIEYFPECWTILPTEYVRKLAKLAVEQKRDNWIGDGGNSHCALVPIEWLVRLPLSPQAVQP